MTTPMAIGPIDRRPNDEYLRLPQDWLQIHLIDLNRKVWAPTGLKVGLEPTSLPRQEVVTIEDGVLYDFEVATGKPFSLKGQKAVVPKKEAGGAFQSQLVPRSAFSYVAGLQVRLEYNPGEDAPGFEGWLLNNVTAKVTLTIPGQAPIEAPAVFQWKKPFWDLKHITDRVTVPEGTYRLFPRRSRANGADQVRKAPHAFSWWLIDYEIHRSFNLHAGRLSEGCATVTDLDAWETMYSWLFRGRIDATDACSAMITVARAPAASPARCANRTDGLLAVYGPPLTGATTDSSLYRLSPAADAGGLRLRRILRAERSPIRPEPGRPRARPGGCAGREGPDRRGPGQRGCPACPAHDGLFRPGEAGPPTHFPDRVNWPIPASLNQAGVAALPPVPGEEPIPGTVPPPTGEWPGPRRPGVRQLRPAPGRSRPLGDLRRPASRTAEPAPQAGRDALRAAAPVRPAGPRFRPGGRARWGVRAGGPNGRSASSRSAPGWRTPPARPRPARVAWRPISTASRACQSRRPTATRGRSAASSTPTPAPHYCDG